MSCPDSSLKSNSLIISTISFKAFARSFVPEPRRVSPKLTSKKTFANSCSESVFRFGAEVRSGDDPLEAQARLIRDGEAATPESLALEKQAQLVENDTESADEIDEEFDGEQE